MQQTKNHIFRRIRKGSQAERLADALISRPRSSGVRRVETMADMAARSMSVRLECPCGDFQESVPAQALAERFGASRKIVDLRPDCPCCGQRVSVIPGG